MEKEKILDAVSKLKLYTCSVCKMLMDDKENEAGEGACFKCWEK